LRRGLLAALALVIVACGSSSSPSSSASGGSAAEPAIEIKIGSIHSLTGPFASLGTTTNGGIAVAVRDVNGDNGFSVGGKRYVLKRVPVDAASTEAGASAAMIQLIRDEGVRFIFGPDEAQTIPAGLSQAAKADTILFTSSLITWDQLKDGANTDLLKHAFAINSGNDITFPQVATSIAQAHPDYRTVMLLLPSSAQNDATVSAARRAFEGRGFTVFPEVRFDPATKDFSPLLTRIKQQHPDVLFTGTNPGIISTVAKQAVEVGDVSKFIFGTGGGAATALTDAIGKPLPIPFGYYTPGGGDPYVDSQAERVFLSSYQQINGGPPPKGSEGLAYMYYPSVPTLVKAMQAAGTVSDMDKIRAALSTVQVEGVGGPFRFNANHQALASTAVCEVKDGNVKCSTVPPPK
jgi:branched-chain amino acid transport system substrate-binding protein